MTGSTESKSKGSTSVLESARLAKHAAQILAGTEAVDRDRALLAIADELADCESEILEANKKDVQQAQTSLASGEISPALLDRLKLDHNKLASVISGIRQLAKMPDPLGKIDLDRELDKNLELKRVTCPIGLIAVIFEARPDAMPQIASLCLKSGDAVILKGGAEAEHSNRILFNCLKGAVEKAGLPGDCLVLLESRSDVNELLKADQFVDLIIPRGSNSLVRYIQDNTRIPVLGHAEGICHIYVDDSADLDKAVSIICDSKVQYPSACNAAETVLINQSIAAELMPVLVKALAERNVAMRCDPQSLKLSGQQQQQQQQQISLASEDDWSTEYGDLIISIKIVKDLVEAAEHINRYGSGHTESMIGNDQKKFDKFFAMVNSAGVYYNASTRFADGFRYGFGAEVGISTAKQHPRGPVGIEGLVTYKYKLIGAGHIVADYVGSNAKKFTHKDLDGQPKQEKI
ncbi:MAG TPA: glutamate-5-semialdehyde dehydrogenase [Drouetiella sp.]|jgi:glutamate-5-semialdehyde dehydrogenase